MVKYADRGGRGSKNPENIDDVICERPLSSSTFAIVSWLGSIKMLFLADVIYESFFPGRGI